jgi:hypothetical protein
MMNRTEKLYMYSCLLTGMNAMPLLNKVIYKLLYYYKLLFINYRISFLSKPYIYVSDSWKYIYIYKFMLYLSSHLSSDLLILTYNFFYI